MPNIVPSAIAVAWLLEPEDEPEVVDEPDESPGAAPVPPPGLGFELVCVGTGNEAMAGVDPRGGAL